MHGLGDFSGLNTSGTDLLPADTAGRQLDPDTLKIRIKTPASFVVSVRDVVTEHRAFAANITFFSHLNYASTKLKGVCLRVL